MKGRGINNLKEFLNSSPSPYRSAELTAEALSHQGRGSIVEFFHTLPLEGDGWGEFFCLIKIQDFTH